MVIEYPWIGAVRGLLITSIILSLLTIGVAIVPLFIKTQYNIIIAIGLTVAAVIEGTVFNLYVRPLVVHVVGYDHAL